MTRIFYKPLNSNSVFSESLSPMFSLNEFLESVGDVEYALVDDTNTAYDKFQECLKIESGVLSYDLALLKEAVQQVRKEKCQELFKPFDKVISDIYALKIPESELGNTHATLEAAAEGQRINIRQQSETQKTAINNATTAEEVLALWQGLNNNV